MSIKILGTGSYLPPKVVTNDDVARKLDTTDEWIYSHTGIHSRHVAGENESTSTMARQGAPPWPRRTYRPTRSAS